MNTDEHKANLANALNEAASKATPYTEKALAAGFLPAITVWTLIAGPLVDTFAQMLKEAIEEKAKGGGNEPG